MPTFLSQQARTRTRRAEVYRWSACLDSEMTFVTNQGSVVKNVVYRGQGAYVLN